MPEVWAAVLDYVQEVDLAGRRRAQTAQWFDELLREAAWRLFRAGLNTQQLQTLRAAVEAGQLTAIQGVAALTAR